MEERGEKYGNEPQANSGKNDVDLTSKSWGAEDPAVEKKDRYLDQCNSGNVGKLDGEEDLDRRISKGGCLIEEWYSDLAKSDESILRKLSNVHTNAPNRSS